MTEAERQSICNWTFDRLAERLAEVFESMSGTRPQVVPQAGESAVPEGGLRWRQSFHGSPGFLWIHASAEDWRQGSNQILAAAGIENPDEETLKSTWTETLGQALASIARDFSGRLGREISCAAAEESAAGPAHGTRLALQFPGAAIQITAALDDALIESLTPPGAHKTAAAGAGHDAAGAETLSQSSSGANSATGSVSTSKTFDLLLDVELPVSVSFGRAQVQLKDVIKLTTGAIVELNRSISEPVEVIVNNCVIARGEVVVVEGNFGVKIREVISRQDRLRTLN